MANKEKKNNVNKSLIIYMVIFAIIGVCAGICGAFFMDSISSSAGDNSLKNIKILIIVTAIIGIAVAMFAQVIIHEGGHLICGLISGYKFVSFRVGKIMLIKRYGKYEIKRFTIPGTGGQCIMAPPEKGYEDIPFKLYFFGGVLFNLITVLMAGAGFFIFSSVYIKILCASFALIGAAYAFMNGIPLNMNGVMNDGYNIRDLSKNVAARKCLWLALKVNVEGIKGKRLADLNDEWFDLPEGDWKNLNYTSGMVLVENRYIDQKNFEAARDIIDKLLSDDCLLAGIYHSLIELDKFYIDVLEKKENIDASIFDDKLAKTILSQMKETPTICRYLYAKAVFDNDEVKIKKELEHFEKVKHTYFSDGEIKSEDDLIQVLKDSYANN